MAAAMGEASTLLREGSLSLHQQKELLVVLFFHVHTPVLRVDERGEGKLLMHFADHPLEERFRRSEVIVDVFDDQHPPGFKKGVHRG